MSQENGTVFGAMAGTQDDPSAGGAERLRLFVAIELPPAWLEALREQERRLESAAPGFGRWVNPDLMHVTLVFLGSQPSAQVSAVERAMNATAGATASFDLQSGTLGCFGSSRAVRVVWAGVQDDPVGALSRLRDRLVEALFREGVSFDETPFHPHITLGRAQRSATPALSELTHHTVDGRHWYASTEPFRAAEITLVRSDLRSTGPIYTKLHREELRG